MSSFSWSQILLLIFPLYLLTAGIYDLKLLQIPNKLNLAGLPLFALVALAAKMPIDEIGWHVLTGVLILVVSFGAYAAGFFGGGDAKFIPVVGLWLGYQTLINFLFYTALIAGTMGLIVLIGGRFIPAHYQPDFFKEMVRLKVVPYGTAMALSALYVYPESPLWALFIS